MDREQLRSLLKALVGPDAYSSIPSGTIIPGDDGAAAMETQEGQTVNLPHDFSYDPRSMHVFEATPRDNWDRMTFLPLAQNTQTGQIRPSLPHVLHRSAITGRRIRERFSRGLEAPSKLKDKDYTDVISQTGALAPAVVPAQLPILMRLLRE